MSLDDARGLPSARLYDTYGQALHGFLPERSDNEGLFKLVGACLALHGFIVWDMDLIERGANPGKPFVLGGDILETGWDTLAAGLDAAAKVTPNPADEFAWQTRTVAEQVKWAVPVSDGARPVTRNWFRSLPERHEPDIASDAAERSWEDILFTVEQPFDNHAAVSFATAAIDRVIDESDSSDTHVRLRQLVNDLWKWQTAEKVRGRVRMTEAEAMAMPSYRFYAQLEDIRRLLESAPHSPKVRALISAARNALLFISYAMDDIERTANDWKPAVVGDGETEVIYATLIEELTLASEAARNSDEETTRQKRTAMRLRQMRPGNALGSAVGQPMRREEFCVASAKGAVMFRTMIPSSPLETESPTFPGRRIPVDQSPAPSRSPRS